MKNILTVDLEDWFSVEVLNTVIAPEQWSNLESVVERNTRKILDIFARHNVKATFFVLGWIADRYPELINDVSKAGHEIACHSFRHRMVSSLTPDEFKRDTEQAINAVVKACGLMPSGYRSPSWGMKRDMVWAYEILADFGFSWDSSIFPIKHDIYGEPAAPRTAFHVRLPSGRAMIEVPASTVVVLGRKLAIGGGGWLRQFPYWFTRWGIKRLNRNQVPAMIYFHPWELDRNLPGSKFVFSLLRNKTTMKNWVRQYKNLITMETKIERLLTDFDFVPVSEYIASVKR